ncbi:hypothetical protein PR048_013699 [Dryococelus australis]|uniref:C2H2-type domain-containing protein n=1 Tax=Dryococelus australis TaxID=614101 RepID=A0ABQ9HTR5_9NEOP|nr:hypothetical protein PR048_013699 [Dryococelus australis]
MAAPPVPAPAPIPDPLATTKQEVELKCVEERCLKHTARAERGVGAHSIISRWIPADDRKVGRLWALEASLQTASALEPAHTYLTAVHDKEKPKNWELGNSLSIRSDSLFFIYMQQGTFLLPSGPDLYVQHMVDFAQSIDHEEMGVMTSSSWLGTLLRRSVTNRHSGPVTCALAPALEVLLNLIVCNFKKGCQICCRRREVDFHCSSKCDHPWDRGDIVFRLFASLIGTPSSIPGGVAPRFSHVGIVSDDAAGWRVFSGISRFPRPCIMAMLHTHLASPSSALKTSIRVIASISSPECSGAARALPCTVALQSSDTSPPAPLPHSYPSSQHTHTSSSVTLSNNRSPPFLFVHYSPHFARLLSQTADPPDAVVYIGQVPWSRITPGEVMTGRFLQMLSRHRLLRQGGECDARQGQLSIIHPPPTQRRNEECFSWGGGGRFMWIHPPPRRDWPRITQTITFPRSVSTATLLRYRLFELPVIRGENFISEGRSLCVITAHIQVQDCGRPERDLDAVDYELAADPPQFSLCPASSQYSTVLRVLPRTVVIAPRVSRSLVHSYHEHLARRRPLIRTSLRSRTRPDDNLQDCWPLDRYAGGGGTVTVARNRAALQLEHRCQSFTGFSEESSNKATSVVGPGEGRIETTGHMMHWQVTQGEFCSLRGTMVYDLCFGEVTRKACDCSTLWWNGEVNRPEDEPDGAETAMSNRSKRLVDYSRHLAFRLVTRIALHLSARVKHAPSMGTSIVATATCRHVAARWYPQATGAGRLADTPRDLRKRTSILVVFGLFHTTCRRKLAGEMCGNVETIIILLITYFINTVFIFTYAVFMTISTPWSILNNMKENVSQVLRDMSMSVHKYAIWLSEGLIDKFTAHERIYNAKPASLWYRAASLTPMYSISYKVSVISSDIPELMASTAVTWTSSCVVPAVASTSSSSVISYASTAEVPMCLPEFPGSSGMFETRTTEVSLSSSAEATASPTGPSTSVPDTTVWPNTSAEPFRHYKCHFCENTFACSSHTRPHERHGCTRAPPK